MMRAVVLEAPGRAVLRSIEPDPIGPHDVRVRVNVVGLCGTDLELFNGTMPYLRQGLAAYPLRPGHEWAGTISEIGTSVTDFAPGDPVTGDTFLGCGRCQQCSRHQPHLCLDHTEVGVRGGRPGALADFLVLPATALHQLPKALTPELGALVEPASCSLRGVRLAAVEEGTTTLIWGAGTLGLLAALFARAQGATVTIAARGDERVRYAGSLDFHDVREPGQIEGRYDVVIDATGADDVPELALAATAPGGHLILLGVPASPVGLAVNHLVHDDITVHGVLGGSAYIDEAIALLTDSPHARLLIGATGTLEDVPHLLETGIRIPGVVAPKVQIRVTDPMP